MKMIFRAFAFLSLALPLCSIAEEELKHPVKPLLWKVEGKDLKKPSYLFGTIHLGGGALDKLHPSAEKAYVESEYVLTEIPLDAATQMKIAQQCIRKDGKTLSQSVGPELTKELDEQLRAINPALNSKVFQPMRTWVLAMSLPMLESQLKGHVAMDKVIWDRAIKDKKKTGAVETAQSQLDIFDTLTEEEQIALLSDTLRYMREAKAEETDMMKELNDAYIQGDDKALEEFMGEWMKEMREGPQKELGEKFYDKVLIKRDESMAANIIELFNKSPETVHFVAAGALHFTGEISILSHIEKAGYRITRIEK